MTLFRRLVLLTTSVCRRPGQSLSSYLLLPQIKDLIVLPRNFQCCSEETIPYGPINFQQLMQIPGR